MTIAELIESLKGLDDSHLVCIEVNGKALPIEDHVETAILLVDGESYSTVILSPSPWP